MEEPAKVADHGTDGTDNTNVQLVSADDASQHSSASSKSRFDGSTGSSSAKSAQRVLFRDDEEERKKLGSRESRRIFYLRFLIFSVLVVAAACAVYAVHQYIRTNQQQDFEDAFDTHADRVLELFHKSVESKLQALDALSTTITSYAKDSGSVFPNVTIPDFEVRAYNSRILSEATLLYYLPLVTDETRAGWEAYSTQNINHILESSAQETDLRMRQDTDFGFDSKRKTRTLFHKEQNTGTETASSSPDHNTLTPTERDLHVVGGFVHPWIHNALWMPGDSGEERMPDGSGSYLPLWQLSPALGIVDIVNSDFLSYPHLKNGLNACLSSGQALIAEAINLLDPDLDGADDAQEHADIFKTILELGQFRHDSDEYIGDPVSPINYPVFDSFDTQNRKVVGLIYSIVYWRLHFDSLLPEDIVGIVCVIENTHGQTFSFRLDGSQVTYVGRSDLHDTQYDHMMHQADIGEYIRHTASTKTRSYTAAKLNEEYSNYQIRVYPTLTLEGNYVTKAPVWYALVVAAVFVFTSSVFVMYDCLVERRQRIVMDRALRSGAVVSSLFPETVRDRLYDEHSGTGNNASGKDLGKRKLSVAAWHASNAQTMQSSDVQTHAASNMAAGASAPTSTSSPPIADSFEHTTILFADIAGFTQWSSSRSPEQVFCLLEALYGSFDRLARRRKVFKVETIGDCYMAATGLPNPHTDHAVIMCRFAHDCIKKISIVLHELADSLGHDTMDLSIRVGLHSGPVMAGVLRGEKSRFQLFGDTVNTASRMESSGELGKIHCSQSTADELIMHGLSSWLSAREGLVSAKGKGEMQTYFVSVASKGKTTQASSSDADNESRRVTRDGC